MLRIKNLICCKNETDKTKVFEKYPVPMYHQQVFIVSYPMFFLHTNNELYQISPARAFQEANDIYPLLHEEKSKEIYEKIQKEINVIETKDYTSNLCSRC